jgi:hypothetical protein
MGISIKKDRKIGFKILSAPGLFVHETVNEQHEVKNLVKRTINQKGAVY